MSISPLPIVLTEGERLTAQQSQSSNRTNTWRLVRGMNFSKESFCSSNRTNTWRLVPTLLKRLKSKCFLWFGFAKNGLTQFVMGLGMVVFAQNLHLIECGAALTFADGAGVVNFQQMQSGHKAI